MKSCDAIKMSRYRLISLLTTFGHFEGRPALEMALLKTKWGKAKSSGQYFKSQQLLCTPSQSQFATWLLTDELLI